MLASPLEKSYGTTTYCVSYVVHVQCVLWGVNRGPCEGPSNIFVYVALFVICAPQSATTCGNSIDGGDNNKNNI